MSLLVHSNLLITSIRIPSNYNPPSMIKPPAFCLALNTLAGSSPPSYSRKLRPLYPTAEFFLKKVISIIQITYHTIPCANDTNQARAYLSRFHLPVDILLEGN